MGERAEGSVRLYASADPVQLEIPTYVVPVIQSAASVAGVDYHRLAKIREPIEITAAGTEVPAWTMLGGAGMGMPSGTVVRVNPAIPGVELDGEVVAPFVAQPDADPLEEPGAIRRVVIWEQLGTGSQADAFWRGAVGLFPAVVIAWESWDIGGKQGRGSQTHDNTFAIFVVCTRRDGAHERRDEAKAILQAVSELLVDKRGTDGELVSDPPATLGRAERFSLSPDAYVYRLQLGVTATITKREHPPRGAPWLKTRTQLVTTPATPDLEPDRLVVVDQEHDMDPETPG